MRKLRMPRILPQFHTMKLGNGRAFTLLEILVTVGIIILLVTILVPALYHAKLSAKMASTRSTMSSIRTGLAQYYTQFNTATDQNDFKGYPDSHPADITRGTYGANSNIILPGRGPALLAQALLGYLPGSLDGAGPDSGPTGARFANDPRLGFRPKSTVMNSGLAANLGYSNNMSAGAVYGPYGPNDPGGPKDPAVYKINDTNAPTDPTVSHDQSFYDAFGNEILYFRAQNLAAPNTPTVIFDTSKGPPGAPTAPFPIFYSDDCSVAPPNSASPAPVAPTVSTTSSSPNSFDVFFPLIAGTNKGTTADLITSYPGPVLGSHSYLLISAGPDGKYFTGDDIVMSDH